MEEEIEKLLCEYQKKVSDCRTQLDRFKTRIAYLRRNGNDYSMERKDQNRILAQMNAYNQAESDIESLLDHLDIKDTECSK